MERYQLPEPGTRVVVKIGTHTLTRGEAGLCAVRLKNLCRQLAHLRRSGIEVVVVSSGAVGLGMGQLGLEQRPDDVATLQACAALGQSLLMQHWRQELGAVDLRAAQVLLTHEDLRGRSRHLAVRATLERLLRLGAIPIVNENDAVSSREIQFGDNDLLSALTASLLDAALLVILTSAGGLYDAWPGGRRIPLVRTITPELEALAGGTASPTAVGGMTSKLAAAKVALRSGCGVWIVNGAEDDILPRLLEGRAEGTFFVPEAHGLQARKRWLAFFQKPAGVVCVDAGAQRAVQGGGKSLLAKGVTALQGSFEAQAVVALQGPNGQHFANGVCTYGAAELEGCLGASMAELQARFPGLKRHEVVHREHLVLL